MKTDNKWLSKSILKRNNHAHDAIYHKIFVTGHFLNSATYREASIEATRYHYHILG